MEFRKNTTVVLGPKMLLGGLTSKLHFEMRLVELRSILSDGSGWMPGKVAVFVKVRPGFQTHVGFKECGIFCWKTATVCMAGFGRGFQVDGNNICNVFSIGGLLLLK